MAKPSIVRKSPADILTIDGQIQKTIHILIPRWHLTSAFLSNAVQVFPYKIHTVLTDNGMAFADLPKNRDGPSRRFLGPHIFDQSA